MSTTICLLANTLYYPEGGGHLWVYLNWALGLRALDCRVIWMEAAIPSTPAHESQAYVAALKSHLERYGLAESVALCSGTGDPLYADANGCMNLEEAAEADLLLTFAYSAPSEVVQRFQRSALVDIDPGLLQVWMSKGWISVAKHNVYFTTGETVGQTGTRFPDVGLNWEYVPPCVAVGWWPVRKACKDAPFTTVSHWGAENEWMEDDGQVYNNEKCAGFLPFLDLPRYTSIPLELALCLGTDEEDERVALQQRGWRMRHAHEVASTPWDYQHYIQGSSGEFSCVKPSCIHLQNAWISDRTLCYLASGKPAIVQHTGASRFLPDAAGLFRFRNIKEAARYLEEVATDYERQSRLARALAEEHFDARRIAGQVLERALT